jgi:hypothetical protein
MKRTLTAIALLTALASQNSVAGLDVLPIWTGTFKDTHGGLMVMLDKAGTVDVSGADSGSIYRLVCTYSMADSNSATCTGDGINYEQADNPQRFTYRSQLRSNADGSISEEWECVFEFNAEKRNGKSLFKRLNGGATR